MSRRTVTCFGPICALLAVACQQGNRSGSDIAAVMDSIDGVPRVTYPAQGGPALPWTLDTVLVIGDISGGDEHYAFGQVGPVGIAGNDRGDLFVLDLTGHHVLSYDSTGTYIASYGRQGNGPGELAQPFALSFGPGDTVWVQGPASHRLTGFPIAGGDPRVLSLPTSMFVGPPLAAVPGAFLMQAMPAIRFSGTAKTSDDDAAVVPLLSLPAADDRMDTLWTKPAPKQDLVSMKTDRGMIMLVMSAQFEPDLRWDTFADGVVAIADDDTYTVHLIASDGHELLRIARDLPPRPTSDHDREFARDRLRTASNNGSRANDPNRKMLEQRIEKMTFAPTIPRITGIRVDGADRIWVGVSLDDPGSTARIDVFTRQGDLLGSLLGTDLPVTFFGPDRAARLRKDPDTDVQQVVVLRLRENAR